MTDYEHWHPSYHIKSIWTCHLHLPKRSLAYSLLRQYMLPTTAHSNSTGRSLSSNKTIVHTTCCKNILQSIRSLYLAVQVIIPFLWHKYSKWLSLVEDNSTVVLVIILRVSWSFVILTVINCYRYKNKHLSIYFWLGYSNKIELIFWYNLNNKLYVYIKN